MPVNFDIEIAKGGYEEKDLRTALETDIKYVLTQFRSSRNYLAEDPGTALNYTLTDKGNYYLASVKTFGITKYPTQIYESISYFIIFLCLLAGWRKYREQLPDGLFLGIFLVSVFGMRFVWEFFKENQVDFEENLTFNMGQSLSIPLVIGGLILIIYAVKNGLKPKNIQGTGS